jgi:hypothetical protein
MNLTKRDKDYLRGEYKLGTKNTNIEAIEEKSGCLTSEED